jgi:hypothetical protein
MKRDLLLELGIAESRAAEATAAEHLGEALRLSATPAARAQVAQELAGFFNVFGRFGESAAVRERAIGECSDREAELRFSLETEAAVLAVTSMPARRRLGSLMARLRAEAEVMTGDRVAAPLLAVLAEELAETDGRAAEVIAYAEFAFADDRLFTRDGAAPGASEQRRWSLPTSRCAQRRSSMPRFRRRTCAARSCSSYRPRMQVVRAQPAWASRRGRGRRKACARAVRSTAAGSSAIARGRLARGGADRARSALGGGSAARAGRARAAQPQLMLFQPLADSQARLLLLLGRTKEADEQLQARLEWQRAWGCRNPGWTSTRSLAALAARALGKASEARTLATENLEAAQAFAAPREIGIALRTMAIVQPKGRIQWLRESVSALE